MSDKNYPPGDFAGRLHESIGPLRLEPEAAFDDIFKNSGCKGCTFFSIEVIAPACRENAWDANNGTCDNKYIGLKLKGGKNPAVYLKDGFCNNVVDDLLIQSYGQHCDWYEGDFSDQGHRKNTNNRYNNVRREDGKPVRVRWNLLGEKPKFTNSNIKYVYGWSVITTIYVTIKNLFL